MLTSAQRKAYGDPPKHHDLYADETEEAVWAWELVQPSLFLEPISVLREVLKIRENLQSQSQLITSLSKVIRLIAKAKSIADLTNVSNAHAKYMKTL